MRSSDGDRPVFVVTGGAGFVGSNLAAELQRRHADAQVVVIDDLRSGSYANVVEAYSRLGVGPFRGQFVNACITEIDWDSVIEQLNPRAVFHLGAITDTTVSDEREMLRVNSDSFAPMLSACVDSETPLVYASSAATYGTPPQTAQRVAFPQSAAGEPNNVYGFSKWMMEVQHGQATASREAAVGAVPHVVGLRYFNVFGPGEGRKGKMASMVYQLTQQVLDGKSPRLFTDGSQARDQVYVGDVVDCTIAASAPTAKPGVYNLGSGVATSFNQIAHAVLSGVSKARGGGWKVPAVEYFEMPAHIRKFYQDFTQADMSETRGGLGWIPKWNSHAAVGEAMAGYAEWMSRA